MQIKEPYQKRKIYLFNERASFVLEFANLFQLRK